MDVVITKKNKLLSTNRVLVSAFIGVLILVGYLLFKPAAASINTQSVWFGQVQQGDLKRISSGFGKLKSKEPRLLTAQSNATVERIKLKPGAAVTPDSIILELKDAQVEQAVRVSKRALLQMENAHKQLAINQKRELLAQQGTLELLKAELESAELEVSAQAKLIEQGIVSNIEYQRRLLQKRQLTRRVLLETQRLSQLEELHQANLQIAESNISSSQEALDLATYNLDKLTVRAGIEGVLQNLSVELGQSVAVGQQLALVGSSTDLFALIEIPQSQMQHVALEQSAVINTRSGLIDASVSRIDPVINGGNVFVELTLNSALPNNARPELNITANIETGFIKDALFIEKPVNTNAFSKSSLYKVDEDLHTARLTEIEYGIESRDKIQIVSGATVSERFILSDMSRWQAHALISLN